MRLHHLKHHRTYVTSYNTALELLDSAMEKGDASAVVPWTKLGQEPVVVFLDRIFILAEPALQVEGSSEEALQEAKRNRVKEMEIKLMEAKDELKPEAVEAKDASAVGKDSTLGPSAMLVLSMF